MMQVWPLATVTSGTQLAEVTHLSGNLLIRFILVMLVLICSNRTVHIRYYTVSFAFKVFQDAIQSPKPAFRYFTSDVVPPLTKLKVTEPDGSRYISTMSKIVFSTEEQWIPPFGFWPLLDINSADFELFDLTLDVIKLFSYIGCFLVKKWMKMFSRPEI